MIDEGGKLVGLSGELGVRVPVLGGLWNYGFFFKDPHLHLGLEEVGTFSCVLCNDLGNCRSPSYDYQQKWTHPMAGPYVPIARSHDRHLMFLTVGSQGRHGVPANLF